MCLCVCRRKCEHVSFRAMGVHVRELPWHDGNIEIKLESDTEIKRETQRGEQDEETVTERWR